MYMMIKIPIEWVKTLRNIIETAAEHISEYSLESNFDVELIREIYAELGGNRDDIF